MRIWAEVYLHIHSKIRNSSLQKSKSKEFIIQTIVFVQYANNPYRCALFFKPRELFKWNALSWNFTWKTGSFNENEPDSFSNIPPPPHLYLFFSFCLNCAKFRILRWLKNLLRIFPLDMSWRSQGESARDTAVSWDFTVKVSVTRVWSLKQLLETVLELSMNDLIFIINANFFLFRNRQIINDKSMYENSRQALHL